MCTSNSLEEAVPRPFLCVRSRITTGEGRHAQICESESYEGIANTIV
jgi:hypothetical protein